MSSVPRAALLGGILAVTLHLLIRLILRNLLWITIAAGMLFTLDRCSPDHAQVAQKRAVRDSFDSSLVTLSNIVGRPDSDGWVNEIAVTVRNDSAARLYDLKMICA